VGLSRQRQLFVNDLLELKGGRRNLRAMLETLPAFYNWQTAFQSAFRENFPRPLDVKNGGRCRS